jgi:hypothetical protein
VLFIAFALKREETTIVRATELFQRTSNR